MIAGPTFNTRGQEIPDIAQALWPANCDCGERLPLRGNPRCPRILILSEAQIYQPTTGHVRIASRSNAPTDCTAELLYTSSGLDLCVELWAFWS